MLESLHLRHYTTYTRNFKNITPSILMNKALSFHILYIIGITRNYFQYDSNNNNYILYSRDIVVHFVYAKFNLKYECTLFKETDVV
jgi:hypothetical protein